METEVPDVEIYNEEQRWWVNLKENSEHAIVRFEDSIKFNKEILILAETKIKELA